MPLNVNGITASIPNASGIELAIDSAGSLFIARYRRSQTISAATTIAATGATSILAAQGANIFADLTSLIITVADQAVTASAFTATLSDGTKSYIFDFEAPVTPAIGLSPLSINFEPFLPATAANTAWTINLSATNTIHVSLVALLQKAS